MRRWLILLTLPLMQVVGCQAVSPAQGGDSVSAGKATGFSTAVGRGLRGGFRGGRGFRGGWGHRRGFHRGIYGGIGFRSPLFAPVGVGPVVIPTVSSFVSPISTIVYPSYAGSYGYFW
jgi:hypothetical protein